MATATTQNWSWNDAPFSTKLDPRRFFPGESQEEAISRLHFLVDNSRRLGLVLGPSGAGKTAVLDVCAKQFRQQGCQVSSISVMSVDVDEFLWKVAAGLGANPNANVSMRELWREIDDRIKANRYQRIATVLMFDDTEEAEADVLTAIARLAQVDSCEDSRLTLLLACNVNRTHLLGSRLQELFDLRIELEPWSAAETSQFIRTSLTRSACSPDLFTETGLEKMWELTSGIPRRVQQLAQLSLIAAAAQDLSEIDESTLEAVQRELSTQRSPEDSWNRSA